MLPHPLLIIAIQDPPSRRSALPTFQAFLSFSPPPPSPPRVAIYLSRSLNIHLSCTIIFHCSSERLSLDILSPEAAFWSSYHSLWVTSIYLLHMNSPPYSSITPDCFFSTLSSPHLIMGDFNLHHPIAGPLRSLYDKECSLCALYLDFAFDAPYYLLNTPRVYSRIPFDTITRPSVLDLAF